MSRVRDTADVTMKISLKISDVSDSANTNKTMVVQITNCHSLLSVLKVRYLNKYINYEHNTPYTIDRNKNVFT
jgi:hypothetical protein